LNFDSILVYISQNPILGLLTLFFLCFLSATILPFPSEVFFITYIEIFKNYKFIALITASLGNTLGGISSYILGYIIYNNLTKSKENKILTSKGYIYVKKYGSLCLVFSWLPIIGDVFCICAGYLKINFYQSLFFILLGKFLRYYFILYFLS